MSPDKEAQYIEWYEQAATKISAQLSKEIKDAGGYSSEYGAKFGSILHEVNGALGNAYTLIALYKHELSAFQGTAVTRTPANDLRGLERMITEFRLKQTGQEHDGWYQASEADTALADAIIKAGWTPPSQKPQDK
jgi:hypothetical protein